MCWERKKNFTSLEKPRFQFGCGGSNTNQVTRTVSASVLAKLAKKVEDMVVSSAVLSNSDKTDRFLKNTKANGDEKLTFMGINVYEQVKRIL